MLSRPATIILFLANLIAFSCEAIAFQAKVIGVFDGDTIEVLKDKAPLRIRIYGIDCPEHDQDYGTRAKQFTSDMVFGKTVEVVPIDQDIYSRMVAKIYINGKYLNQMIVAEGLGWWYERHGPKEDVLREAENDARSAKKGLWSHTNPIPPWEFRKQRASSNETTPHKSEPKFIYRGNVKSRVFHNPDCKDYNCPNCTAKFISPEEALKSGYRPCKLCLPPTGNSK
ncbi:MAG: thermonuclease family protein [Pseudomonadota bacterium]